MYPMADVYCNFIPNAKHDKPKKFTSNEMFQ